MKKLEWLLNSINGIVTGFKITDIKENQINGHSAIIVNGVDDYIDIVNP